MAQRASIPILGIDERPKERRVIPGLASTLRGVRPTGLPSNPQWEPIANTNELTNESSDPFTHSNESGLLRLFWHTRSLSGKHGETGSLRRLVALFDNGSVEIIDPDKGDGFEVVATYSVTSTESGDWEASFTQLYDTGYLCVSKGGKPQKNLLIEDDLILSTEFPELPIMRMWFDESEDSYSQEELDSGTHKGFKATTVFIRYALRLGDGTLVKHSAPELLQPRIYDKGNGEFKTSYLVFYNEGYGQINEPTNFDYWKDKIKGVSVLISSENAEGVQGIESHLESTGWYELTRLDFIDPEEEEEPWIVVRSNEESITGLPVADVDDGTHHNRVHGVCDTYNSRVLLGNEVEDYVSPTFNQKEGLYNHLVVSDAQGLRVVGMPYQELSVTLTNTTNMSDIVVIQNSINTRITYLASGATAFTLNVRSAYSKSFSIFITSSDIDFASKGVDRVVLPVSSYSHYTGSGSGIERSIELMIEIETDNGYYKRLSETITTYTSASGTWLPQGSVLFYPDSRVKRFTVFANLPLATGTVMEQLHFGTMKSGSKANYSIAYGYGIGLYSNSTISLLYNPPSTIELKKKLQSPSKVRVSNVNSALALESALIYNIGKSSTKITAFAVNAQEVSQGQFGQYPLYIMKEDSIWALEQSASVDVVFGRITPVDASLGVESEYKIINIGRLIAFATRSGIYVLSGVNPELISDPVQSIVPRAVCLGFRRSTNDKELLVALNNGQTYYYSTRFQRWYSESHSIRHFFSDNDKLFCINNSDEVKDYQSEGSSEVSALITMDSVHFGAPDLLKRFRFFYLRGLLNQLAGKLTFSVQLGSKSFSVSQKQSIRPKWKSVYETSITIDAKLTPGTHYIEEIDTEFESRYPRKLRRP